MTLHRRNGEMGVRNDYIERKSLNLAIRIKPSVKKILEQDAKQDDISVTDYIEKIVLEAHTQRNDIAKYSSADWIEYCDKVNLERFGQRPPFSYRYHDLNWIKEAMRQMKDPKVMKMFIDEGIRICMCNDTYPTVTFSTMWINRAEILTRMLLRG